jgi:acetylglutamate kinase
MVAKLTACEAAVRAGVKDVVIVDGRDARQLARWLDGAGRNAPTALGTRVRR